MKRSLVVLMATLALNCISSSVFADSTTTTVQTNSTVSSHATNWHGEKWCHNHPKKCEKAEERREARKERREKRHEMRHERREKHSEHRKMRHDKWCAAHAGKC
jgi:uncharacterized membrane protein